MKSLKKNYALILTIFCTIFYTGCPVKININNNQNESIYINFSTIAGSKINNLITSLNEQSKNKKIFDTFEIEKSLAQLGFDNVEAISRISNHTENLSVNCSTDKNTLNFINITFANNKISNLSITLSPQILQELIISQDSIIQKYADLLMAPCFTGEEISKDEYIDLLSSVYGKEIAEELIQGNFTISINNSTSKNSVLTIPLIDILTLTNETTFTLTN